MIASAFGNMKPNPRGRIHDWKQMYKDIESLRKNKHLSLEASCAHTGIAISTYHTFKKRLLKEKK